MLLKNLLIILSIFALTISSASAFQMPAETDYSEPPREGLTISEDNFSCFQHLQCLIKENPFQKSNLNDIRLNNSHVERYVVEGSSKNESMHAVYTSRGDLIKATVIQKNIVLPKAISDVLASGNFKPWTVIGTELVIENFDKNQMQYKVVLQHEGEVRIEYFNKYGEFQNRFM
jgi:hypothetical protein